MSMNTPTGGITQITPIKNFQEISELDNEQYLLGIKDYSTGSGGKVKFETLISDSISENNDNIITTGTDGKLLVNTPPQIGDLSNLTTTNKSTLVGAINEVDGDVGNLSNLTTSVKTNVVNAINSEVSARNTAETNIQNDYNGKIGTLSNLDTTDKSNIVGAINELAAIAEPSLQYETMNNSKALETGVPSENPIILGNVQKYAHSTFDSSKFTVVGSPIITDGIASGFSSSNYLMPIYTFPDSLGDLNIVEEVKFTSLTININQCIYEMKTSNSGVVLSLRVAANYVRLVTVDSNQVTHTYDYNMSVSSNMEYLFRIKIGNNLAKVYLNNELIITADDFAYNTIIGSYIGVNRNGGDVVNGSIDLKQFSITVDGVPVFSGNKTGIATIKPDNYTVVGTPTISADGIASGFSTSNYLTATLNNNPTSSVDFECRFKLTSGLDSATAQDIVRGSGFVVLYAYYNSRRRVRVRWGSSSDNNLWDDIYYDAFAVNTWYVAKGHYDVATKTSTLYLYDDNGIQLATQTATLTGSTFVSGDFSAYIGTNGSSTSFSGSIDLNGIKLSVDGDLVYQPCLKIPYTESFTGSKIVDAIYRNRVVDAYEQGYPQRFYTLQEDKKGNYYIVGSPTISSDFIASGFDTNKYLVLSPSSTITSNLEINFSFTANSVTTGQQYLTGKANNYFQLSSSGSNQKLALFIGDGTSFNWINNSDLGTLSNGTEYNIKIVTTANEIKTYVNGTLKDTTTVTNFSANIADLFGIIGNRTYSTSLPCLGSIDLKQFSVTVDNNVVYKVVSDPNFALPMGEIYGDIEYNRANKLDLTTANATQETVSKINGWCVPDYANGVSKVVNTVYQAAKNVYVKILNNTDGGAAGYIYIGTTNNPATEIAQWGGNVATANTIYYMIPKGYYYKVSGTGIYSITEFPFMGE